MTNTCCAARLPWSAYEPVALADLHAAVFYLGSAVIVIVAVLLLPFGQRMAIRSAYVWASFHYWCAHVLLGIETRVEGAMATVPTLYACKHESMFETAEMLRLFFDPAVVFKRELLRIPGWGWVAERHGVIPSTAKPAPAPCARC